MRTTNRRSISFLLLLEGIFYFLISLTVFHTVLSFTFWKDDWISLWGAFYNNASLFSIWLHPATLVEFFFMSKLFGLTVLPWLITGIVVKAFAAWCVARMVETLTNSHWTGFLSGIFFAGLAIGMDTVGWPSIHVVNLVAALVCLTVVEWLRFLDSPGRANAGRFLLTGLLAFVSDPWRVIPLMLVLPVLTRWYGTERGKQTARVIIHYGIRVGLILVVMLALWQRANIADTLIVKAVRGADNPAVIWNKLYLVGNYLNSVINGWIGWIIAVPESGSTGEYNRLITRIGIIVGFVYSVWLVRRMQSRGKRARLLLFLFLWPIVFYFPNFLFEPRVTVGASHRYLVLSSIGLVGSVSVALSFVRDRRRVIVLALLFVFLNDLRAQERLAEFSGYRAKEKVDAVWTAIEASVPDGEKMSVFLFQGEEPIKTYVVSTSGSVPFVLRRKITERAKFPIMTQNREEILGYLCSDKPTRDVLGKRVAIEKIPFSSVHAWYLRNDGSVIDESVKLRTELLVRAIESGCLLK